MTNIKQIVEAALVLGIKLTHADLGTDLFQCWSDRVALAKSYFETALPQPLRAVGG